MTRYPRTDSPDLGIVAFMERESYDPVTGEEGILRDEWRVTPLEQFQIKDLEEHFGPRAYWSKPYAKFVLEHRYIRRGKEELWIPLSLGNDFSHALESIDSKATAVDQILKEIQKERIKYAAELAKKYEKQKMEEREKEERVIIRRKSKEAFVKVLDNPKTKELCEKWNLFVSEHSTEQFRAWAKSNIDFMASYEQVTSSTTFQTKRKALKEFLAKYGNISKEQK